MREDYDLRVHRRHSASDVTPDSAHASSASDLSAIAQATHPAPHTLGWQASQGDLRSMLLVEIRTEFYTI